MAVAKSDDMPRSQIGGVGSSCLRIDCILNQAEVRILVFAPNKLTHLKKVGMLHYLPTLCIFPLGVELCTVYLLTQILINDPVK